MVGYAVYPAVYVLTALDIGQCIELLGDSKLLYIIYQQTTDVDIICRIAFNYI